MLVANIATLTIAKAHMVAFWLFQQATDDAGSIGWDPIHLWKQMSWVAQVVVVILFIMSAWSIGV
ncbi:MAG TPA: flagellar motor protein MotA, partial [Candidatus Angelobacter sp.]|nr:flagellar motor protein MotA [Candidatus Angelobacter sp.]